MSGHELEALVVLKLCFLHKNIYKFNKTSIKILVKVLKLIYFKMYMKNNFEKSNIWKTYTS